MAKFWRSKQTAYGEAIVLLALGGLATYVAPVIGIPVLLALLSFGVYLVWRSYRRAAEEKEAEYISKMIAGNKAGPLLSIPKTVETLVSIENTATDKRIGHEYSPDSLLKIRNAVSTQTGIQPLDPSRLYATDEILPMVKTTVKKLGLPTKVFTDDHVDFLLKMKFGLDKTEAGIRRVLLDNPDYISNMSLLRSQMTFVSTETTRHAVMVSLALMSGLNNSYLYISYHPESYRDQFPSQMQMTVSEFEHDRDVIFGILMTHIRWSVEAELRGRTK